MDIDFSADLFGPGGDGLWLGDIEPSAGGKGFQISANFGDVGSTYELTDDLFIQKVNEKKIIPQSLANFYLVFSCKRVN